MVEERKFTARSIAFWVMYLVIIGSIVYANRADTRHQISASESRQIDRSSQQIACMFGAFQDFLTGNQELRDASEAKDDAVLASKEADSQLTLARDILELPRPEIKAAAQNYRDSVEAFKEADRALDEARRRYKLPDIEKLCRTLTPEFKGAWLAQVEGFGDVQPYATGLTIEPQ